MIEEKILKLQKEFSYIASINIHRDMYGDEISDYTIDIDLVSFPHWVDNEKVKISFEGVKKIQFGNIENLCKVYISVLDIKQDQLESLNYKVTEIENDMFSFYCKSISFNENEHHN